MNEGKLITAKDAENILDAWATLKTHRPFRQYELHEVTIKVNGGTITFICEDYIIRDTIATFSNVRTQKSYVDNVSYIVPKFFKYDDNQTSSWRGHNFIPKVYVCDRKDFAVIGYTVNGDKTAHESDIINIDSYVTEPTDKWYTTTEELALIKSTDKIVEYNQKMIEYNRKTLLNEKVDQLISYWEELFALHKYYNEDSLRDKEIRSIDNVYDKKVAKHKFKWIGKLLVRREKYPPRPVQLQSIPIPKGDIEKYLKELKRLNLSLADGIDTTYLVSALGGENKNSVENAEYTEVE